jgi:molybdate transport system substrate-binding protein
MQRLADGERPDVIVSTTESLESLPEGSLAPGSIAALVRTGIGIGVAAGRARPRIATTEQLAASLRAARSVAYSRSGQSGIYFARLIQELGIAEEVNAKATVIPKGFTGEALLDGRADIAIQQISELRFVPGVDVVGPLPGPVQQYTDFSVALGLGSKHAEAAHRLRGHLVSEAAQEAYARAGLQVTPG